MLVSKKKWKALEKRVAALEEEQLKQGKMICDYIENEKVIHDQIAVELRRIPGEIIDFLCNNSLDK